MNTINELVDKYVKQIVELEDTKRDLIKLMKDSKVKRIDLVDGSYLRQDDAYIQERIAWFNRKSKDIIKNEDKNS